MPRKRRVAVLSLTVTEGADGSWSVAITADDGTEAQTSAPDVVTALQMAVPYMAHATDPDPLMGMVKARQRPRRTVVDARQAWDEVLDKVTEALEEEFADAGRKSVPEHTALSAARRSDRLAYQRYRGAKRTVERLQSQLKAKTAALNGRQSEMRALVDESRLPSYAEPRPAGGQVFGGIRA